MKRRLDVLRLWLLQRWWGRNLANIITITGFVGAYLILFWTSWGISGKMAGYIATEVLDAIDGPVARWLGNTDGIGKIIDPIADKVKKFFALYFLFLESTLVHWVIIWLLSFGEIGVFIFMGIAVYLAFKREYCRLRTELKFKWWRPGWTNCAKIYKNTKEEIFKNWQVVQEGKLTMVYYAFMFGAIFLRSIWMTSKIFVGLYWIFAIIGFIFRLLSFLDYRGKLLEWQSKASAGATRAG